MYVSILRKVFWSYQFCTILDGIWDVHREDLGFFADVDGFLLPYRVCTSLAGIMIIRETFGPVTTWKWKLVHQSWVLGRELLPVTAEELITSAKIHWPCSFPAIVTRMTTQQAYLVYHAWFQTWSPPCLTPRGVVVRRTTSTPTPNLS